jgi:hypothetical protein
MLSSRGKKNMKFEELLKMPKSMDIEEFNKLLKKQKRIKNRLTKVSNLIYDEIDSLEVLSDEIGSDRYNRHLEKLQELENEQVKLLEKLKATL